jgi:hypothetical protein
MFESDFSRYNILREGAREGEGESDRSERRAAVDRCRLKTKTNNAMIHAGIQTLVDVHEYINEY